MSESNLSKKELMELKEMQEFQEELEEEQKEDMADDQQDSQIEFQEGYQAPEPIQAHNAHTFLHEAAFITPDTLRVSFLDKDELGKPIFNVRFLLDMEDIASFYLDDMCKKLKINNKIADYFRQKVINITDSGMSSEGFAMTLNTTRNIKMTRTKRKERIENLKGGRK